VRTALRLARRQHEGPLFATSLNNIKSAPTTFVRFYKVSEEGRFTLLGLELDNSLLTTATGKMTVKAD
jgi:hypothetical protein